MALVSHHPGQHGQAQAFGGLGPHQHQCRRPVRDGAGIGRRDGARLAEGRFQGRYLVGPGLARLLVVGQQQVVCHHHGCQLCLEGTASLRRQGPLQGGDGEGIHVGPGQPGPVRAQLGVVAHQVSLVGILQAVEEHVIQHALVAHAKTAARLVQQIGGPAHALHAPRHHHIHLPQPQPVCRQHHRLHAGAAHLVDGGAGHAVRQPGLERRLTGRCLPDPGAQHIAQIDLIDPSCVYPGCRQGGADGAGAKLGRTQCTQGPLKGPHGGTFGRHNHYIHQSHSPCYIGITYAAAVPGTRLAGKLTFG
ncbi:hypothetical protein D3C72_1275770 [compost metagenome]